MTVSLLQILLVEDLTLLMINVNYKMWHSSFLNHNYCYYKKKYIYISHMILHRSILRHCTSQ